MLLYVKVFHWKRVITIKRVWVSLLLLSEIRVDSVEFHHRIPILAQGSRWSTYSNSWYWKWLARGCCVRSPTHVSVTRGVKSSDFVRLFSVSRTHNLFIFSFWEFKMWLLVLKSLEICSIKFKCCNILLLWILYHIVLGSSHVCIWHCSPAVEILKVV